MFWYTLVSTVLACTSAAPTAEESSFYVVPNDTATCAKDLIKWCDGMKYPQEGAGMSMIAISMHIPGEGFCRVLCTSDLEGTNCTKNGQQWFSCSKDNEFRFKGEKPDPENPQEGICDAAEKAFNDIMVQNLFYDNGTIATTMEKAMEGLFKEMADMREMMADLSRRISMPFGGGWPFTWWSNEDSEEEEETPEYRGVDQVERE